MEEKAHPGKIVIEVETVEIDAAHARDADEDKFFRYIGDRGVQTSNLPVEWIAIESVFAAKDDENRLAASARLLASLFPIAQPARFVRLFRQLRRHLTPRTRTAQTEDARQQPPSSAHRFPSMTRIVS